VDDWYPELVEQEAKAKDDADVVFFVVGPETRAIASMIEVAELITTGRDLVLVLQDVPRDMVINGNVSVTSLLPYSDLLPTRTRTRAPLCLTVRHPFFPRPPPQTLPPDEVKDLNRGRAYLANVADRHNVTVYQSLEVALQEASSHVLRRRAARGGLPSSDVEDAAESADRASSAEGEVSGDRGAEEDCGGESPAEEGAVDVALEESAATGVQARPRNVSLQQRRGQLRASQRPSLTSAIADLASQFVHDELGVSDAISEDDDDEQNDCDDDDNVLHPRKEPHLESIVGIEHRVKVAAGSDIVGAVTQS
jgi:hypothetical protein